MGLSAAGVAHDDHSLIQRAIDLHQHVHFYLSKMDGSSANCIASSDFSLGFCIIVGIFVYIYIYIQYIYIHGFHRAIFPILQDLAETCLQVWLRDAALRLQRLYRLPQSSPVTAVACRRSLGVAHGGPARRGSDGFWEVGRCWNMLDPKFRVIGDIAQDHVRHCKDTLFTMNHTYANIVWFFMFLFLDA